MDGHNNNIRRKISEICKPTTGTTKEEQYEQIKYQNSQIENELGFFSGPLYLTQTREINVNCHAYSLGVYRS